MKASELIEKLQKAIELVGDADVKSVDSDDCLGGITLSNFRYVSVSNYGDIVISEYSDYGDIYTKLTEI